MAADGMEGLRRWRDQAQEMDSGPERGDAEGDGDSGTPEAELRLPPGCPVVPLGIHGDLVFYLDELRQLRDLKAEKHSRLNVQALFGRQADLLYAYWPRKAQNKTTGEWETTAWRRSWRQRR